MAAVAGSNIIAGWTSMAAVKPFVLTRLIRGGRREPDGAGEELLQGPRGVLHGGRALL
ncbi:hypothetical protein E2C01_044392 [Portunus trituberculatus]|uniref:Uncharacterized protein n=1 Tax=Portunus trituberculatus TaxID=210409 RepID=A0A5B7FZX0_PORTR|nr:hypothetical protein [Portunus trituberculatus]